MQRMCDSCAEAGITTPASTHSVNPDWSGCDLCDECAEEYDGRELLRPRREYDADALAVYDRAMGVRELRTTDQVMAELGLSRPVVIKHARALGVGRLMGRDWVFTLADVEALRNRNTTPGRPKRSQ